MALDEHQLAIVLQASIDRAGEMLRADGGFLPFGARAKPSGEIEFLQIGPAGEAEPLTALIGRLGEGLADEARRGAIVGSALVVNAHVPGEEQGDAIAVLVETEGFCRSIVVPYRLGREGVAFGEMIPQPAAPKVFADPAGAGQSII
jgi:hypothetical protein